MFEFFMGMILGSTLSGENKKTTQEAREKDIKASILFLFSVILLNIIGIYTLVSFDVDDFFIYISWIFFTIFLSIAISILELKIIGIILLLIVPTIGIVVTYLICASLGWDNNILIPITIFNFIFFYGVT